MKLKFDKTEFDSRINAKKELKKPHPAAGSVEALRDRVAKIEKIIGVIPDKTGS